MTAKHSHSPAPFDVRRSNTVSIVDATGEAIAMPNWPWRKEFTAEEFEANIALFVAIPALLDALKPFMDQENRIRHMGDMDGRIYLSVTAEEYAAAAAALSAAEEHPIEKGAQ